MSKEAKHTILLGDLTHTGSKAYSPNQIPYPVGCIKSYFLEYSKNSENFEIKIFKDPQKFCDAVIEKKPSIIGFSNYVWNLELSSEIAKQIKLQNPDTLIIFGGPNFPLEDSRREQWLKNHPFIDLYIIGEGEEPFTQIVDLWYETQDIQKIKQNSVMGCYSVLNGKLCKAGDFSPRISNLDDVPSPYLNGYLDEFLQEPRLSPLMESNRGCPFSCSFCVDGIQARSKVYMKSVSRFEQELEYIAQRYKGKTLTLADLNFGMYRSDVEISEKISKIKEKYGYPYYIQVSTGKNNKARVLECAELLKGSMGLAASVQSLDKDVLTNVRRNNISEQKLVEMTKAGNKLSANTYSEVILALPGDTIEKHFETVSKLMDAKMKIISMYQCMILEGSELSSELYINQWKLITKFRVLPRCYGIYYLGEKQILAAEVETVGVGSSTMSLEDYYECRSFALSEGIFYQDRAFYELFSFLENFGIKPSEVVSHLHNNRANLSNGITELFKTFDEETRNELWDDKEELLNYIKSDKKVLEKYISGKLGINVLFKHRAIAAVDLIDEIHDAVFNTASEIFRQRDFLAYQKYIPYLNELKIFSVLRKRNVFDVEKEFEHEFTYDFQELIENDFEELPKKLTNPVKVFFYSTQEQKELMKEKIDENGSDVNGLGKILSRMMGTLLQRSLKFDNKMDTKREKIIDIGVNNAPGDFV
ncbi:anaerobic magnesium-protoporphyrin IX monomethyl ester cyclase protein [Marine Group I thaumarchaeote SCGC AAA799-P11]|uniref:Anaerobic magnesium-protoporphyrin IX monomethyl ester cyclase protein n=1 Tax=Marine Group I thaumarchaeote SCGC AAA799-P11 TaxID=1502295 RepID=A0A087S2Z0_9ARCH|nr:anaerobic magnesium-protoporphyrin IX monomethyl ester cyclase protein [Marine Group I thaumarchaeote SCGC AAA799-P11]